MSCGSADVRALLKPRRPQVIQMISSSSRSAHTVASHGWFHPALCSSHESSVLGTCVQGRVYSDRTHPQSLVLPSLPPSSALPTGVCPECGPNHGSPPYGGTSPPRGPPPNAPHHFLTHSYGIITHSPSYTHIPNQNQQNSNGHLSYAFTSQSQSSSTSHYPQNLDVPSPYGAQQPRPTYNFHTSGVPVYQPPYVTGGKQPTAPPMNYPYPSVDLRKLQQG